MLTVVMPFYKKFREFQFAFDKYSFDAFNDYKELELIICVDDPAESENLTAYLADKSATAKPLFAIKVFVNYQPHTWRCPCKAINVGIQQASHQKIVVLSPETIPLKNSLQLLSQSCDPSHFSIGIIKSIPNEGLATADLATCFSQCPTAPLPYGSVCFTKSQADKVSGYDENFIEWGGDDDDFRERLLKAGYQRKPTFAKFIHVEYKNRELNKAENQGDQRTKKAILDKLLKISSREHYIANEGVYGRDFDHLAFEYSPKQMTV